MRRLTRALLASTIFVSPVALAVVNVGAGPLNVFVDPADVIDFNLLNTAVVNVSAGVNLTSAGTAFTNTGLSTTQTINFLGASNVTGKITPASPINIINFNGIGTQVLFVSDAAANTLNFVGDGSIGITTTLTANSITTAVNNTGTLLLIGANPVLSGTTQIGANAAQLKAIVTPGVNPNDVLKIKTPSLFVGNITIAGTDTIEFITTASTVNALIDGPGTLKNSADGTKFNQSIGSTTPLALLDISGNTTLNANATATKTTIALGKSLTVNDGFNITGPVDGFNINEGTLIFAGNGSSLADIGATNSLSNVKFSGAYLLNNNLSSNTITIDNTGSLTTASAINITTPGGLTANGTLTLGSTAKITGPVTGNALITLGNSAEIVGNVVDNGGLILADSAKITGQVTGTDSITLGNNAKITGALVNVNGSITLGDNAVITAPTTAGGVLTLGTSASIVGDVTANGNLILGNNASVVGNVTANNGLVLGSGAFLDSAVVGAANGLTLNGNATLGNVNSATALSGNINLGKYTATINDDLFLNPVAGNNIINIEFNSPTVFGNIDVKSTALILNPMNVAITTSGYIPAGNYTILQDTSGLALAPLGTITSNTLLTNFAFLNPQVNSKVQVAVTRIPIASYTLYPNTAGVGAALDQIEAIPGNFVGLPDFANLFTGLDQLANETALNTALATIAPIVDGSVIDVSFLTMREGMTALRDRLDKLRLGVNEYNTGYMAGDAPTSTMWGAWVKVFASRLKQEEYRGFEGYRADITGLALGADYNQDDKLVYGLGLSFSSADVTSRAAAASLNTIDNVSFLMYASYHFDNPWYIDGMFAFGQNDYDQVRSISAGSFSSGATAKYEGWQISARLESGFVYKYHQVLFQPFVSLYYSLLDVDSYTETGAGNLNLSVSPRDVNTLQIGIGPKISRILSYGGSAIVPEVHAQYLYDLNHEKQQVTSQFINGVGPEFLTTGIEPKASSVNAGFSISAYGYKSLVFVASYDYEWKKSKFTGHHGYLKFKYIW